MSEIFKMRTNQNFRNNIGRNGHVRIMSSKHAHIHALNKDNTPPSAQCAAYSIEYIEVRHVRPSIVGCLVLLSVVSILFREGKQYCIRHLILIRYST